MGIGLGYVRELSKSPSNTVFALVRSLTKGDLTALQEIQASCAPGQVRILECDVSSPESVTKLPAQLPSDTTIDVLINNAAILHGDENSLTLKPETLHEHIQTNVLGPALVFQTLLPYLSPTAKVVNISSGLGSMQMLLDGRINADRTAYSVSKAALNMLTVHQAKQVKTVAGKEGVIVVCVDPGWVKTEMGGPNAVLRVEDSVQGVLKVIEGLRIEDSGGFFLYRGDKLDW